MAGGERNPIQKRYEGETEEREVTRISGAWEKEESVGT